MRLSEIEEELGRIEQMREYWLEEKDKALRRKRVVCRTNLAYKGNGCGARFNIGSLTYIQTHFYVQPFSCTGGDYWKQGEGAFNCPKCGYRNRLYDRKEIQELKRYFKDVVDEH